MHNISNLFYFGTTLYMFRTVSPSIIGSLRLYIQHQVYVIQVLWLLASKATTEPVWYNVVCTVLDCWWWMVLFQNKINLRYCASGWFYYRKNNSLLQFLHQLHAPYITIYRKRKNTSLYNLLPLNCMTTAHCLRIRMKSVWRKVVCFVTPHPTPPPPSNATFTQCLLTEAKTIHQLHNSFMPTIRQQIINHNSGGVRVGLMKMLWLLAIKKHIPLLFNHHNKAGLWSVS